MYEDSPRIANDEGDLKADKDTYKARQAKQGGLINLGIGEGEKTGQGEIATNKTNEDLDKDEPGELILGDVAWEPGANAHTGQEPADNQRKLGHWIAQKVAGQCARKQFIDQTAYCHEQGGKNQVESGFIVFYSWNGSWHLGRGGF